MNLPIDVVVDLLMANCTFNKGQCDHPYWIRMDCNGWRIAEADSQRELRSKVREYLLTLAPKPKLLSECEEGVEYLMVETPRRVCREFIYAVDVEKQQRIARADQVQVIQPVEVK